MDFHGASNRSPSNGPKANVRAENFEVWLAHSQDGTFSRAVRLLRHRACAWGGRAQGFEGSEAPIPTVIANGTELYYERSGTSSVPLVFVHGSWGDHHNWDAVVPALARSFDVVTYDRRGHSQSPRPSSQGSLHEDAMDLAALLEGLGVTQAHLVGNSFGAAVCLRLATERPELFRSLVVHEPPLFGLLADDAAMQPLLAEVRRRVATVIARLEAGDTVEGARQFVETIAFGPGAWDTIPERMRQTFIANAPTWLDESRDPESSTLNLEALGSLRALSLVTHGDESPPFFPAVVAKIAAALPKAKQYTFKGAGHVPHLSHSQTYVEVIRGFLSE